MSLNASVLYDLLLKVICQFFTVAASEIQMMALPHTQYVIAEATAPVSGVNSNQVKTVSSVCTCSLKATTTFGCSLGSHRRAV